MSYKIHVDDAGTKLAVTVTEIIGSISEALDVSSATTRQLILKHVDSGTKKTVTAVVSSNYIVWVRQSVYGTTGNQTNTEDVPNRYFTTGDFIGGDDDNKAKSVISVGDLHHQLQGSDFINDTGFVLTKPDGTTVVRFKFSVDSGSVTNADVTISINSTDSQSQIASAIQAAVDGHADFSAEVVSGKDGKIHYVLTGSELTLTGLWKLQAKVVVGSVTYMTSVVDFYVHPNL